MRRTEARFSFDKSEPRLFDGTPEELRSENAAPPSTLKVPGVRRSATTKPFEGGQHAG